MTTDARVFFLFLAHFKNSDHVFYTLGETLEVLLNEKFLFRLFEMHLSVLTCIILLASFPGIFK